jgi:hypothetical protein
LKKYKSETSSITGSAVASASNATNTSRETRARVPVKNLKKRVG